MAQQSSIIPNSILLQVRSSGRIMYINNNGKESVYEVTQDSKAFVHSHGIIQLPGVTKALMYRSPWCYLGQQMYEASWSVLLNSEVADDRMKCEWVSGCVDGWMSGWVSEVEDLDDLEGKETLYNERRGYNIWVQSKIFSFRCVVSEKVVS